MGGKAISSIGAQQDRKKKTGKYLPILFLSIFALAGAGMLYPLGIRPVMKTLATRSWPAIPCKIISADVRSHSDSDGTTYRIDIVYEYEFNGGKYTSKRYDFIGGSSSGYQRKSRVVESYRKAEKPVCYVNPEKPSEAVLKRGFHLGLLLALVPLLFLTVGVGGIIGVLKSSSRLGFAGTNQEWLPAKPRSNVSGLGVIPVTGLGNESVTLRLKHSPWAKVLGAMAIAAFWNGIVAVFVVDVVEGWRSGHPNWFLTFFMVPFVLIGFGLIAAVVYQLLATTNPRPVITLSSASAPLGGEVRLSWEFIGRTSVLQKMRIVLRGREEATYRRGTKTHTDKNTFCEMELYSTEDPQRMAFGQVNFLVPADSMHSFEAENNKIIWGIAVHGNIKSWPDVREDFRIIVTPTGEKI